MIVFYFEMSVEMAKPKNIPRYSRNFAKRTSKRTQDSYRVGGAREEGRDEEKKGGRGGQGPKNDEHEERGDDHDDDDDNDNDDATRATITTSMTVITTATR